MISKELLSEVWKWKYATVKDCRVAGKHIEVTFNETNSKDKINIYELAHKCKEWAFNEGYYLHTVYIPKETTVTIKEAVNIFHHYETIYADTEPEAIFMACQWILDNKGK